MLDFAGCTDVGFAAVCLVLVAGVTARACDLVCMLCDGVGTILDLALVLGVVLAVGFVGLDVTRGLGGMTGEGGGGA